MRLDEELQRTDWERQRAFLAVMREGSLSAAARALTVAQATVRRRIEDLERQHGVLLFTRSPTGLLPTAIAHDLLGHVEAMSRAAASFTRAASAEAGSPTGTVRITASEVIGVEVLPRILGDLRLRHPGLVFELGLTDRSEDLLNREADIGVRMIRPTQEALVAKRVGSIRLGLHAHRAYLRNHGTPNSLVELKELGLIGFETETAGIRKLRQSGLPFDTSDFILRTNSGLGQLAAIRNGLGIGVCHVALGKRDPNLVRILPDVFELAFETWIVTHENLRNVLRVKLAFEALVAGLSAYADGSLE